MNEHTPGRSTKLLLFWGYSVRPLSVCNTIRARSCQKGSRQLSFNVIPALRRPFLFNRMVGPLHKVHTYSASEGRVVLGFSFCIVIVV
jgi:hypothetical protein